MVLLVVLAGMALFDIADVETVSMLLLLQIASVLTDIRHE
jgi:hypothetical protein